MATNILYWTENNEGHVEYFSNVHDAYNAAQKDTSLIAKASSLGYIFTIVMDRNGLIRLENPVEQTSVIQVTREDVL